MFRIYAPFAPRLYSLYALRYLHFMLPSLPFCSLRSPLSFPPSFFVFVFRGPVQVHYLGPASEGGVWAGLEFVLCWSVGCGLVGYVSWLASLFVESV